LSVSATPLSSLMSATEEEEQTINNVRDDELVAHWTQSGDVPFVSDILVATGPQDCSLFADFDIPDLAVLNDIDTRGLRKGDGASECFPAVITTNGLDSQSFSNAISSGGDEGGPQQQDDPAQLRNHNRPHQIYCNKPNNNDNLLLPHQAATQWLAECVRMADELERYIHIRLSAVDEVMRINKQSINRINSALEFEEYTPSVSLLGLTCLVMSHIVTLYELAADGLTTKGNLPRGPLPPNATSFSTFGNLERRPTIHFGNFCLDFEEHQAIQEQIFIKELQRCSLAATKLLGRLGFDHADGGRLQNVYSTWQSDIVSRVEKVQSTIKKED
jgi:hypothetical protein